MVVNSSHSGMVMIQSLLEQVKERIAKVEITTIRNSLKLFFKELQQRIEVIIGRGSGTRLENILLDCSFYGFVICCYFRYTLLKLVQLQMGKVQQREELMTQKPEEIILGVKALRNQKDLGLEYMQIGQPFKVSLFFFIHHFKKKHRYILS